MTREQLGEQILVRFSYFQRKNHRFGTDQLARANYFYRSGEDPPSTPRTDTLLKNGEAVYVKEEVTETNGETTVAPVVDPEDDTAMWTLQEYAVCPANTWGSWWEHIG